MIQRRLYFTFKGNRYGCSSNEGLERASRPGLVHLASSQEMNIHEGVITASAEMEQTLLLKSSELSGLCGETKGASRADVREVRQPGRLWLTRLRPDRGLVHAYVGSFKKNNNFVLVGFFKRERKSQCTLTGDG